MFVEGHNKPEKDTGLIVEDALLPQPENGLTHLVITNLSGLTRTVSVGTVGVAEPVEIMLLSEDENNTAATGQAAVRNLSSSAVEWRKKRLLWQLQFEEVPTAEATSLKEVLAEYRAVFSLEDGERGETDIITTSIDIGDAQPIRQPPSRMLFVIRGDVAKHLRDMQHNGVIQPSSSPWSSPVVVVRKKYSSHCFCVDYRKLNAVTRTDAFSLLRINDLLDQLRGEKYL